MFILNTIRKINSAGNEPFLPPPPYNPKTGESLVDLPHVTITIKRPTIRKNPDLANLLRKLDPRNDKQLAELLDGLESDELLELVKELLKKAKR